MPVMLLVLPLQGRPGRAPPAAACVALPQAPAPADATAMVEAAPAR